MAATTIGGAGSAGGVKLATRGASASAGSPKTSIHPPAGPGGASVGAGQTAGAGAMKSWAAALSAMLIGTGSTSAAAPAVNARHAKTNATEPVRRVRGVVAMGGQGASTIPLVTTGLIWCFQRDMEAGNPCLGTRRPTMGVLRDRARVAPDPELLHGLACDRAPLDARSDRPHAGAHPWLR